MQFFGELEALCRFIEELILKHDVSEVGLLLEEVQELIESDHVSLSLLNVEALHDLAPVLLTLHDRLIQFLKEAL
jgi:hypothetical protein